MKRLWTEDLDLKANLQKRMPKLAEKYFDEGRAALTSGTSWEEMHAFRLRTKRFRYTLETFRDLYGPGMEDRIESLKKVQSYLGDINDCIVTSALLEDMDGMADVRKKLDERANELTEKLRDYWSKAFDDAGAEKKWTQYLVSYACRRKSHG